DALRVAAMFRAHGADILDVSAGMTSRRANPVYGRMFQTPFSEMIRNEIGVPTIAVGAITTADQINTIVAAGRADLCALARPPLTNPHFTLVASAEYGYEAQLWPSPYLSGKDQAFRLYQRQQIELQTLRAAAKPSSHDQRRDLKQAAESQRRLKRRPAPTRAAQRLESSTAPTHNAACWPRDLRHRGRAMWQGAASRGTRQHRDRPPEVS